MIGSRAASGSVAIRLRNVVIACSASSRSASMFTSSRFAPPRTCSSATSTAPWKSSASIEPAELRRARDVRPLADHDEARVRADDERLETGEARQPRGLRDAARRETFDRSRDLARVLRRRPAAAADEVDETVLGERPEEAARVARLLVVQAERVRQAGVRMAGDVGRRDVRETLQERPHLGRAERAVHPDDERLGVLDRDPERVRRLAGEVAPAPVDRGEREPERDLGRDVDGAATIAALAFSVSKIVSTRSRSTPPSRRAAICSSYVSRTWSNVTARYAASSTRGESESVTLSGPTEPATKRGLSGVRSVHSSAARRASRAPSRLISAATSSSVVVRLADPRGREGVRRRDVRAGGEVGVVDLGDDLRAGSG